MKTAIPERYARTINNGLALCVIMIGISGALETQSTLLVIVSMVVGTVAGTALKIEERLGQLGDWAQKRFSHGGSRFSEGFVNATLLFGVGAMAVVGSLEAGLSNKPDTSAGKIRAGRRIRPDLRFHLWPGSHPGRRAAHTVPGRHRSVGQRD